MVWWYAKKFPQWFSIKLIDFHLYPSDSLAMCFFFFTAFDLCIKPDLSLTCDSHLKIGSSGFMIYYNHKRLGKSGILINGSLFSISTREFDLFYIRALYSYIRFKRDHK